MFRQMHGHPGMHRRPQHGPRGPPSFQSPRVSTEALERAVNLLARRRENPIGRYIENVDALPHEAYFLIQGEMNRDHRAGVPSPWERVLRRVELIVEEQGMDRAGARGGHGMDSRDRAPIGRAVPGGVLPRGRHGMGYVDDFSDEDDDYSSSFSSDASSDDDSEIEAILAESNVRLGRAFGQPEGHGRHGGERIRGPRIGGGGAMSGHRAGGRDRMAGGGDMGRHRMASPRREGGGRPNPAQARRNPAQARRNPDLVDELRGRDMGT
ncbi:MAG: hypothetical protein Q9183_003238, partial [Haloplaca sp. 2 TL-2023]